MPFNVPVYDVRQGAARHDFVGAYMRGRAMKTAYRQEELKTMQMEMNTAAMPGQIERGERIDKVKLDNAELQTSVLKTQMADAPYQSEIVRLTAQMTQIDAGMQKMDAMRQIMSDLGAGGAENVLENWRKPGGSYDMAIGVFGGADKMPEGMTRDNLDIGQVIAAMEGTGVAMNTGVGQYLSAARTFESIADMKKVENGGVDSESGKADRAQAQVWRDTAEAAQANLNRPIKWQSEQDNKEAALMLVNGWRGELKDDGTPRYGGWDDLEDDKKQQLRGYLMNAGTAGKVAAGPFTPPEMRLGGSTDTVKDQENWGKTIGAIDRLMGMAPKVGPATAGTFANLTMIKEWVQQYTTGGARPARELKLDAQWLKAQNYKDVVGYGPISAGDYMFLEQLFSTDSWLEGPDDVSNKLMHLLEIMQGNMIRMNKKFPSKFQIPEHLQWLVDTPETTFRKAPGRADNPYRVPVDMMDGPDAEKMKWLNSKPAGSYIKLNTGEVVITDGEGGFFDLNLPMKSVDEWRDAPPVSRAAPSTLDRVSQRVSSRYEMEQAAFRLKDKLMRDNPDITIKEIDAIVGNQIYGVENGSSGDGYVADPVQFQTASERGQANTRVADAR